MGAVMRDGYGDVVAEYRALTTSVAMVQGAHDLVWVEGPGAGDFLQGLISQDVAGMPTGGVARSFFLSPQGKLEALLWVARGTDSVGLLVDAGRGPHLAERLEYYRIRVKAEVRQETRDIWELWGPDSLAASGLTAADRWEQNHDRTLIPIPMRNLPRVVMVGQQPGSGLPMAGALATSAVRVENLEPVFERDVDSKTIPQETGLTDSAVSFEKGCYLGQELVARIDTRGHVNRVLRSVAVTRSVLPPEGAAVFSGDREVGRISSVSENLVSPIGLILIRHEVSVGHEVTIRWDGGEAPAIVKNGQPA